MRKLPIYVMTLALCYNMGFTVLPVEAALYKTDVKGALAAQDNKYKVVKKQNTVITVKGAYLPLVDVIAVAKKNDEKQACKDNKPKDPSYAIIEKLILGTDGQIADLPVNYKQITIAGEGEVTKAQATAFIKIYNNKLPIAATPGQIVDYYYREAGREGIKWDMALCQALLETGFFNFGGTVVPEQNNYCGLGTTNATTRGVYFFTPLEGVRAHIQHLMAYSVLAAPKTKIIDPRYYLVHDGKKKTGFFNYWSQLNGKWATSSNYSEKIIDIHEKMKKVISVSGSEIW
ncbi:hypothetical protein SDC9_36918 [bioreactor metagenome]|jgi:Mannosyl-glycoprotein endo-beta-N-acetylglucosaminidase.|uniref:Mannosyl-glycoprotein endo-beta-N-acetylglucosamidase-like domain-containing protein n=1 Tax=bioreactor metagenome TaxID=1076179 RepID=A0A644VHV5_9ZZZZ|nr:glucosaminidase domain-containing protein [Acidaminococcaceae bacterium]